MYCAEVSWYSSLCQPDGGEDLPCQVEGDDAVTARDALIVHQRAVLPSVGAGGVQTQQRGALAGLLDIEPMFPPEQIEMHVAAGDRLELDAHAL